jgi:GT2 family glycosyltransferase
MRPPVDVVVPFRGSADERRALLATMRGLELREGDTLTIVDNGPEPPPELGREPSLIHAPERQTSYYARNRGAERGRAEWIVFLDADVLPQPGLLDGYFAPPPGERVGVLGGGMRDEEAGHTLASRYAAIRRKMAHDNTLDGSAWAYAQTANAAVRRTAFEELGGFEERVRSGGDADLCFRARAHGWALEPRPGALIVHRNRTTWRAMARQLARHGAGSAWLARRHGARLGSKLGLGSPVWSARILLKALWRRERDGLLIAFGDVVGHWAFGLGRFLPNEPR